MKLKFFTAMIMMATAFVSILLTNSDKGGTIILKAYKNTIALYENGKQTEIYSQIVLDTLPVADVVALKEGIYISDAEELLTILEDFDG